MRILLVFVLFISINICQAQEVKDITARQVGNNVEVIYTLRAATKTADYFVTLYCSTDGGQNWKGPLKEVKGYANEKVIPGTRWINWNVTGEWDYLYGENIRFKVVAESYDKTEDLGNNTFKDLRDNNVYKYIKIGNDTWMAENIRIKTETESACYDEIQESCVRYGRLYTWVASNTACPKGWHLPSLAEAQALVAAAGGRELGARKIRSVYGWQEPSKKQRRYSKEDIYSSNETGFNALPAGMYSPHGDTEGRHYIGLGWQGSWWTSELNNSYQYGCPYYFGVVHWVNSFSLTSNNPKTIKEMRSVRCVKDK